MPKGKRSKRYNQYLKSEDPALHAPRTTWYRLFQRGTPESEEECVDQHGPNNITCRPSPANAGRPSTSRTAATSDPACGLDLTIGSVRAYDHESTASDNSIQLELSEVDVEDDSAETAIPPTSQTADSDDVPHEGNHQGLNLIKLPVVAPYMKEIWSCSWNLIHDSDELNTDVDGIEREEETWYDCGDDFEGDTFTCDDYAYEQSTESEIPQSDNKRPLYDGAPLTLENSLYLILMFVMKYQLSGECLQDLLTLISLHCAVPNLCKTSVYLFEKHFADLKTPLVFHKFCSTCFFLLKDENLTNCTVCNAPLTSQESKDYFIEIPLISQLVNILSRKGLSDDLKSRFQRKKSNPDNVEDIYDGELYQEHCGPNGFLCHEHHISLFWYTDGIPLFKSSKSSIWPLYFIINELPFKNRILKENMIFAGLWYGSSKPYMNSFLEPFHSSLQTLKGGFQVKFFGEEEFTTVRGMLLGGTCDLPAKSIVLNMKQFNGAFGCTYCKQEGKHIAVGRGYTHVYPFDFDNMNGPKRTHKETVEAGMAALTGNKVVDGIKGLSWFMFLGCDIIKGTAIDYMHQVLLGIVRKLLQLWFSSNHSGEAFSLSSQLVAVDRRLLSIKPPNFLTRVPRSIAEHMKYWKASECRSFLFYYSVPVLCDLMDPPFFSHYLLLVEAIYLLNSSSISLECISRCEALLSQYVCMFSSLYGEKYMTANIHLLLHLADSVRNLGPLWVQSCFHFESVNGELLKFFHGTQKPELQIANGVGSLLKYHTLLSELSDTTKDFFHQLSGHGTKLKKTWIGHDVAVVGAPKVTTLPPGVIIALRSYNITADPNSYLIYNRLYLGGNVYHSKCYSAVRKRNSYTVSYTSNGQLCYGEVLYYILTDGKKCFAVIHRLSSIAMPFMIVEWSSGQETPFSALSKVKLTSSADELEVVVPIESLRDLLVFVCVDPNSNEAFVAMSPNNYECD